MAARKPARGRKKKTPSSRSKTASRKRKGAPRKTAGRKKKVARKQVRRKKAAAKSAVTRGTKARTARRKTAARKPTGRKHAVRKTKAKRQPAVPSGIGLRIQHMDYTSHAMDEVKRFYTETLGFTDFSMQGEYLVVQTGSSSSLGFMPPMPGPPDQWQPPREPTVYFMVEDVDRIYRELTGRGVEFDQAPQDTLWGHRMALLRDPEGRTVCLAHVIKK